MKKIIFLLLLFTLFWSGTLLAESAAILIQLNRPDGLYVGKHRIAVSEGTTFYLYSARDYRFIGKFGKKGEGPREFKGRIDYIRVSKDSIIVSSSKKVSRFSIDGTFQKKVLLPVFEANPIETNPIAFYQNRIYQLTENQNEEWELHITPF